MLDNRQTLKNKMKKMELVEELAVVQARQQYLYKEPRELSLIFLMISEVSSRSCLFLYYLLGYFVIYKVKCRQREHLHALQTKCFKSGYMLVGRTLLIDPLQYDVTTLLQQFRYNLSPPKCFESFP